MNKGSEKGQTVHKKGGKRSGQGEVELNRCFGVSDVFYISVSLHFSNSSFSYALFFFCFLNFYVLRLEMRSLFLILIYKLALRRRQ